MLAVEYSRMKLVAADETPHYPDPQAHMSKPACPSCKSPETGLVEFEADWQPGQDLEKWECSECRQTFQILRSRAGYVEYV
jgi:hypothetical protein